MQEGLLLCSLVSAALAQADVLACSEQLEGQNCSYSMPRGAARFGICQPIGPANHSMLACLSSETSSHPDPACQSGLFHTSSRACCASYCPSCREAAEGGDAACSVQHILRLAPLCSEASPPCVVAQYFALAPTLEEVGTTERTETTTVPATTSEGFSPVVELVLPLAGGFLVCGSGLTLCCYCLHEVSRPRPKEPTSPASKACVVGKRKPRPKGPKRKRLAQAEELPALIELEPLEDLGRQDEPIPLIDIWAPDPVPEPPASVSPSEPVPEKIPTSPPDPEKWAAKWSEMEADLEIALANAHAPKIERKLSRNGDKHPTKYWSKIVSLNHVLNNRSH